MNILLVGNPNVGKTSIYNCLTGARARVGNYPGVTVERRYAKLERKVGDENVSLQLTDAPGTYSLVARSAEEQIVIDAVLGWGGQAVPHAIIAVVNAAQLNRNLYLVLQLLELRVPMVVALNMLDDAQGQSPTAEQLQEILGVPCVATNGQTGSGTEELLACAIAVAQAKKVQLPRLVARYAPELLQQVDRVAIALPASVPQSVEHKRALALWALMSLERGDELQHISQELRSVVAQVRADFAHVADGSSDTAIDLDLAIVQARYHAIDEQLRKFQLGDAHVVNVADRVDRFVLHPLSGGLTFLVAMLVVFQAMFAWADPAITLIEDLVTFLQNAANSLLPPSLFSDLFVQGVLGGVGNVIVFLPQILLLFLLIGLMEDSGYMARVAYLMDRTMKTMGLHGRAFVPLLSGFACAIPAIMATRTLEHKRDRLLTMLVVPLMTCSARLPIYSLIIAALFPVDPDSWLPTQALLLVGMYLFSIVMSLVSAWVLSKTVVSSAKMPLILELPPYRWPRLSPTLAMMRSRASSFLREAGTVILAATILLWVLLSFPRVEPMPTSGADQTTYTTAPPLEQSYGGQIGKAIEPVMKPLGFDWKINTAIIGAFAAREVFVSTLGLIFGMEDLDDEATALRDKIRSEKLPNGKARYTPLMGLSLMVFFALACQCMSTLAVVKRETGSYRWPAFLFVYMTSLAYICSLLIYQLGSALGY